MRVTILDRLGSIVFDIVFVSVTSLILSVPIIIASCYFSMTPSHTYEKYIFISRYFYVILLTIVIFFLKDSVDGRSFGKRIMGLQVIDNRTKKPASPLRCLFRNLFVILWPIDFFVIVFNPDRQIGDFAVDTRIVKYDATQKDNVISFKNIFILFTLCLLSVYLIMKPVKLFLSNIDKQHTPFVFNSFDFSKSQQVSRLLTDSLSEYLTPNVQVYDKMVNSNSIYVSVIIDLKVDLDPYKSQYEALNDKVVALIQSQFTTKVDGELKYFYKHEFSAIRPIE